MGKEYQNFERHVIPILFKLFQRTVKITNLSNVLMTLNVYYQVTLKITVLNNDDEISLFLTKIFASGCWHK